MPALPDTALHPALQAPAHRRVWRHPELRSHSLLVLTTEHVHLSPLAGAPKAGTVAAVEDGTDLDIVLGPLATVVDLAAVRRVRFDLRTNGLTLELIGTGGASRVSIGFATAAAADAFFRKVRRRLGNDVTLTERYGTVTVPQLPMAMLLTVIAVGIAAGLVTGALEVWIGTGILALGTLAWLARRFMRMPDALDLIRP